MCRNRWNAKSTENRLSCGFLTQFSHKFANVQSFSFERHNLIDVVKEYVWGQPEIWGVQFLESGMLANHLLLASRPPTVGESRTPDQGGGRRCVRWRLSGSVQFAHCALCSVQFAHRAFCCTQFAHHLHCGVYCCVQLGLLDSVQFVHCLHCRLQ